MSQSYWDSVFESKNGKDFWQPPEDVLDSICSRSGSNPHILDLGCGLGGLAARFAQRNCVVDAMDISPVAIDLAKRSVKNVNFWCDDINNLKDLGRRYDVIIMNLVLPFIANQKKALETIHQSSNLVVLSALTVPQKRVGMPDRYMERDELETLLNAVFPRWTTMYLDDKKGYSLVIYFCEN